MSTLNYIIQLIPQPLPCDMTRDMLSRLSLIRSFQKMLIVNRNVSGPPRDMRVRAYSDSEAENLSAEGFSTRKFRYVRSRKNYFPSP